MALPLFGTSYADTHWIGHASKPAFGLNWSATMRISRSAITVFAAVGMIAGTPALAASDNKAAAGKGVAAKLSLAAANGAGQSDCVARTGADGLWEVDAAGNWVRCKRAGAGKAGAPGQAWLIVGAVG